MREVSIIGWVRTPPHDDWKRHAGQVMDVRDQKWLKTPMEGNYPP